MENIQHAYSARLSMLAILVAGLTACASTPQPPVASLEAARQSISNAEQVRAAEDAPLELQRAREKLHAANNAVDNENMVAAERLAQESRVLAELAFAKAEMADARRVNDEIVRTTEVLREELQRDQRARRTGGFK